MATHSQQSTIPRDLALTVWLEELARGRRVLWVGDASSDAAERLAAAAQSVRIFDATRSAEELSQEAGGMDLAVIPDVSVLGDLDRALQLLSRALGDGLLVAGHDAGDRPDEAYAALFEPLGEAFGDVRMLAEGAFHATGMVDLEAEAEGVVVDGSLLGEETEPIRRFVALAGLELPAVEPHVLVQVREDAAREVLPAGPSPEEVARWKRENETLRDELDRNVSRLEQAQAMLVTTEQELAEARAALGGEVDSEIEGDVERFEDLLRDRATRVRELEAELERRAILVRDLTEALREAGLAETTPSSGGDGLSRALDAEAARDEAVFRADELQARLAAREREIHGLREAEAGFEGRVRGYRSRIAELEELGEIASARVSLFELDLVAGKERIRELQAELAETREELELAMIRARGPRESAAEPAASTRIGELEEALAEAERRVATLIDERDRARAETIGLTAQVGLLETQLEGLRLGYETRIAMLGAEIAAASVAPSLRDFEALRGEVGELRGARDGLRLRVRDLEASLAERPPSSAGDPDVLRADLDALRAENADLTLRLATAEEERATAAQRAADLTAALAARDALVTRLQMDLAEEEQAARQHDQSLRRLLEENDRLREGVLSASEAVTAREEAQAQIAQLREALAAAEARAAVGDAEALAALQEEAAKAAEALAKAKAEAEDAQAHVAALEKRHGEASVERAKEHAEAIRRLEDELAARRAEASRVTELEDAMATSQAREARHSGLLTDMVGALRYTRKVLDGLRAEREGERRAPSEITAVGADAPESADEQLKRELADKETLLRSLTAQLEERDDRLRAMERRLAEGPRGEGGDVQGELLELEERVARLQEELHHERDARSAAEQELESLSRRPNADEEIERVRSKLQTQEAALDVARSRARAAAKDVESLREVCADTRHGLEELLGVATSAGDPATAERIGALLSVLSRY